MSTVPAKNQKPYIVPALERGLKIIELLANNPGGLSLTEMSSLRLPAASLYRLLITLTELGYTQRDNADRYHLGRKLLTLGYKALDYAGLPEKAALPMRNLRDAVQETVVLGVISGNEGVAIDTVRSEQAVCVSIKIGHHFPLHTAAPAKAILAFLPQNELANILEQMDFTRFTELTICSRGDFLKELAEVRKNGIAYDMGEELNELRCVAAPIFDSRSFPAAAVWVTGPASRLDAKKLQKISQQVKITAEIISSTLL